MERRVALATAAFIAMMTVALSAPAAFAQARSPLTSATTARVTTRTDYGPFRVLPSRLNVRRGPGLQYAVIEQDVSGDQEAVICQTPGTTIVGPYGIDSLWDRVDELGYPGYVSDAWLYTGSNSYVAPRCTTSTAAASVASCSADQLTVTTGPWEGAGGHGGFPLLFTNRSTTSCTLVGYPGAAVLNSAGQQVMQAVRTPSGYEGGLSPGTTTSPVITVPPGQTAAARLEWIENPQAPQQTSCPSYGSVIVTPPNTYRSTELHAPSPIYLCTGLEIHPVLLGTTGAWWAPG